VNEQIKHFFFRAAKQAGITSVSKEKRADLATSMRRPGDVKIGSTRHGWGAASGKTLLIDVTTISSVCATWVTLSAEATGGGGKEAAAVKTRDVLRSGELSEDQYFLALGVCLFVCLNPKATYRRRSRSCSTPGPSCTRMLTT
jgi:hypothetical protein